MAGYPAWRAHADSLLKGQLKPQGLGLEYALKPMPGETADEVSSGGLGWRGWTRILTGAATVALGTVAVIKHLDSKDAIDKLNKIDPYESISKYNAEYVRYWCGCFCRWLYFDLCVLITGF